MGKLSYLAINRVRSFQGKIDEKLDVVNRYIFPEVNPILWTGILMLEFFSYDSVKSIIERSWDFGLSKWYSSNYQRAVLKYEEEVKRTVELALLLFENDFTGDVLKEYKKELESLKYGKDSIEEGKRKSLLEIFEKMMEYRREKQIK